MSATEKTALFGLELPQLQERLAAMGQKPYRAKQLWDALYKQRVNRVEEISTFSADLRDRLAAESTIGLPEIVQAAVSVDGTERYLMRMADGETVETVWMPDGDGGERGDGSEAAEEEAGDSVTAVEAVAAESDPVRDRKAGFSATPSQVRDGSGRNDEFLGERKFSRREDKRNWGALAEAGYRRATICISSQVGCAVNCQFCLTAKLGVKRT